MGRDGLDGCGDGDVVGNVDLYELCADLLGGGPAALFVAGAEIDGVADSDEPAGGFLAEALVRRG